MYFYLEGFTIELNKTKKKEALILQKGNEEIASGEIWKIGSAFFLVDRVTTVFKNKDLKVSKKSIFIAKMSLVSKISQETFYPAHSVIRKFFKLKKDLKRKTSTLLPCWFDKKSPMKLSSNQKQALEDIQDILQRGNNDITLQGVPGAGKTFVYINLMFSYLIKGKQVLIFIPQKNLAYELYHLLKGFFPKEVMALYNSSVREKKEKDFSVRQKIYNQEIKIIIGNRSACFLTFSNLGLIIMDEEHDEAYNENIYSNYNLKNDFNLFTRNGKRFNSKKRGRNLVYRLLDIIKIIAKEKNIPLLRVSATPSIRSFFDIENRDSVRVFINKHYYSCSPLVKVEFVENRAKFLIPEIIRNMEETFVDGGKIIVFLNQLGISLTWCPGCKKFIPCRNCDKPCTFLSTELNEKTIVEKDDGKYPCLAFSCLLCKSFYTFLFCKKCGSSPIPCPFSCGVDKFKEYLFSLFPFSEKEIISVNSQSFLSDISFMEKINSTEVKIIISTKVLAKGVNLQKIKMVIIPFLDSFIFGSHFFTLEYCYNFLLQATGRVNRFGENKESRVFIQYKDEFSKSFFKGQKKFSLVDYNTFYVRELRMRKENKIYPYSNFITVNFCANEEEKLYLEIFINCLKEFLKEDQKNKTRVADILSFPVQGKKFNKVVRYICSLVIQHSMECVFVEIETLMRRVIRRIDLEDKQRTVFYKKKVRRTVYFTIDVNPVDLGIFSDSLSKQEDIEYL